MEWPEGVVEFGFEVEATMTMHCILLEKAMYGTVRLLSSGSRNYWLALYSVLDAKHSRPMCLLVKMWYRTCPTEARGYILQGKLRHRCKTI